MDKKSEQKTFQESKEQTKEKSSPEKPVQKVQITFRENRKFDLHIGRNMITFRGRETKSIPKEWVDHKDFEIVKKYFNLKGV